jgi:hypothetical protein
VFLELFRDALNIHGFTPWAVNHMDNSTATFGNVG